MGDNLRIMTQTKLIAQIKYNEQGIIIDIWKGDELVDSITIWEMDYDKT